MKQKCLTLIEAELARRSLADFATLMMEHKPAPHHELLIEKLELVEQGKLPRLMVFMPPGHAKSTYSSVLFPAWYVGRNPNKCILTSSYGSGLAERFGGKVRDLVRAKKWPFEEVHLSPTTRS